MDEDDILEQTDSTSLTPTSTITKKQASVWEEYEKKSGAYYPDKRQRALCIHCREHEYVADTKTGTTNLHRHLEVCKKRPRDWDSGGQIKVMDQAVYHEKLAKCVLLHGRAFSWAEAEGDREVHSYLNNSARFICRNTMKSKCLKLREKHFGLLKTFLESLPGKVCLTTDLWTSIATEGYLCLTLHCIDNNWKLSSRILNFRRVPPPHSAMELCEVIHKLLKEWGLERKVLSITMDNAANMDNLHKLLSTRLSYSEGQLFHIRCCSHILNLIVQAGLQYIGPAVKNVRESVKYVKGVDARIIKFKECAELVGCSSSKGLWLDVVTRWNSTFQMLDRAILYRRAFERLSVVDKNYTTLPSVEEWHRVHQIHKILKPFDSITNLFSGSDYPTSNLYFENVWKIQVRLSEVAQSSDWNLQQMAAGMIEKFDKYWGDYSHILSFAAILDPRQKMGFVRARYKKLNEEAKVTVLREQFEQMFKEYASRVGAVSGQVREEVVHSSGIQEDGEGNLSDCDLENEDSNAEMTEFEMYLAEPKPNVPANSKFDILNYWKENQVRYPVLSAMARDILCIPITTVASESSFSIGGRILNKWRSCLLPDNVEALITTRSWIYGYKDYGSDDEESNNAGQQVHLAEQTPDVQPSISHV